MSLDLTPGAEMPARTIEIRRDDLRAYADASGDHNPIHLEDAAALALGLPGVVAHGMLTMALAVGAVAGWVGGAERVAATRVRFSGPVVVPADAPAVLEVSAVVRAVDATSGVATVALTATSEGRRVFGKATVDVRPAGR